MTNRPVLFVTAMFALAEAGYPNGPRRRRLYVRRVVHRPRRDAGSPIYSNGRPKYVNTANARR